MSSRQTVPMFLGKDLIVWLLLALGGALFAGNLLALVRPPEVRKYDTDLERAATLIDAELETIEREGEENAKAAEEEMLSGETKVE